MNAALLLLLAAQTSDLEAERALASRVSDVRARDAVRALVALGPRMGGTPSGDRAAAWLEERFEGMGLATVVREDPAKRCHWEERWSVVAHVEGQEPLPLERATPWGFSPSASGRATLTLEPVEGGVWLSESRARPRRGAPTPAVVLVDGVTTRDGEWPLCRSVRGRTPAFGLSRAEGAVLRAALEAEKAVGVEYELVATIAEGRPRTVVATLPAREGAPAGHLLFCAHGDSDSGGPGANDNGSGEAIVLEIARAWSSAIADGTLPPPTREVRFAVWGSEIHSTRAYLEEYAEHGTHPVLAVINYDQAGFGSGAEQLNVEPDDLPANAPFVRLCAAVLGDHVGAEGFPARWATNKSLGGTDSYVFSGSRTFRREARPSVTLFTSAWDKPDEHPRTKDMPGESWSDRALVNVDYDATYHSTGDTPENTTDREPHNMAWCARVGLLVGLRWLDGL